MPSAVRPKFRFSLFQCVRAISVQSSVQTDNPNPEAAVSSEYSAMKCKHNSSIEIFSLPTDAHNVKKTELLKHSKITLQHVSVYVETIFRELQTVLG